MCLTPTFPPGWRERGRAEWTMPEKGRVSTSRTHRHTQSNKVRHMQGVMSVCGAIRGCGLSTQGEQISWVCLVERGRSHNPEQSLTFTRLGSQAVQLHFSTLSLSLAWRTLPAARHWGEGATSRAGKWKHKRTAEEKKNFNTQTWRTKWGEEEEEEEEIRPKVVRNFCNVFLLCSLSLPLPPVLLIPLPSFSACCLPRCTMWGGWQI